MTQDPKKQTDPYASFRELLNQNYQFPTQYIHKFIGKNSPIFLQSVQEFEAKFIGLVRTGENQSASGKHVSLTYHYHAAHADDVVLLTVETSKINDLIYIL
jgi:putative lipoic acid-binding regulatory protein